MPGMAEQPTNHGGPLYWLGRRSGRFWIAVTVVLPVLYVASFPLACWMVSHRIICARLPAWMYRPILWSTDKDRPELIARTANELLQKNRTVWDGYVQMLQVTGGRVSMFGERVTFK